MTQLRLFIDLYADSDFREPVVTQIKHCGYDIITANELGHYALSDEQQLAFATKLERAILTHNICDFAPLHHHWWNTGQVHAGIIVVPQVWLTGEMVRRLLKLLNSLTAEEMVNNYVHLGQFDPAP